MPIKFEFTKVLNDCATKVTHTAWYPYVWLSLEYSLKIKDSYQHCFFL